MKKRKRVIDKTCFNEAISYVNELQNQVRILGRKSVVLRGKNLTPLPPFPVVPGVV